MAWGGVPGVYDEFECPQSKTDWHRQIEKLTEQMRDSYSHSIRALIQKDIDEILASKYHTILVQVW